LFLFSNPLRFSLLKFPIVFKASEQHLLAVIFDTIAFLPHVKSTIGLLIISLLIILISITNTAFEKIIWHYWAGLKDWQSTCEILLQNRSLTEIEFFFLLNLSFRVCYFYTHWVTLWGQQWPRFWSDDHFAKHTVAGELDKNTRQTGSVVDLRPHERTGSPFVKNKTRSRNPELEDCEKTGLAWPEGQNVHTVRLIC